MEEYCKNCGALIKDNSKFCHECGSPLEKTENDDKHYCKNCGKELNPNDEFCTDCGTSVKNPKIPHSQPQKESFIEKYKMPIAVGIIVVIIFLALLVVGSMGSTVEDVGTQNVEVGSTNFIIPGDYKVDPSTIDVDYKDGSAVFTQAWANPDGDLIYISTMTVPYGLDSQSMISANGGVQKEMLGGYNGYYFENDGAYAFSFETGGYVCLVGASDPNILDEITCLG